MGSGARSCLGAIPPRPRSNSSQHWNPLMEIKVTQADSILSRYADQIEQLGAAKTARAFARALNHEGDKGRTQTQRALTRVTGISFGDARRMSETHRAFPG